MGTSDIHDCSQRSQLNSNYVPLTVAHTSILGCRALLCNHLGLCESPLQYYTHFLNAPQEHFCVTKTISIMGCNTTTCSTSSKLKKRREQQTINRKRNGIVNVVYIIFVYREFRLLCRLV